MTTKETETAAEWTPPSRPEGEVAMRLWIGHNPIWFVVMCLLAGYLLARTMSGGRR